MESFGKWNGIQFPTHKRKRAQRKREIIQMRKLKRKQKNRNLIP
jgi:hypothetical protein